MKIRSKQVLIATAMTLAMPATATTIGGVWFPAGPMSFADEVFSYTKGGAAAKPYITPDRALGPPGVHRSVLWDSLSLGHGGSVTLRFLDNTLTASGNSNADLYVFDASYGTEDMAISVSTDSNTWISVGKLSTQTKGIDLDAYGATPGVNYSYVRLVDLNSNGFSAPWAGAEVNAVGAITGVQSTVQNRGNYRSSSTIYLNRSETCLGSDCGGGERILGDTKTSNQFQVNLEYDGNYLNNAAVENFNDRNYPDLNMADASSYGFQFDAAGNALVRRAIDPEGVNFHLAGGAHWAITYKDHTALYGTWGDTDDNGILSHGDYLEIFWNRFQTYPGFGTVMQTWKVEHINAEINGYTYKQDASGTYLEPDVAQGYNMPLAFNTADPAEVLANSCVYNPNSSYDGLMLILLSWGLFYAYLLGIGRYKPTARAGSASIGKTLSSSKFIAFISNRISLRRQKV